jgi:hypothetical protein
MNSWNLALNLLQALPSKREAISIIKSPFTIIYITKDCHLTVSENIHKLKSLFNPLVVVEPDFRLKYPENASRLFKLMKSIDNSTFYGDLNEDGAFDRISHDLKNSKIPFLLQSEIVDNKRRFVNNNCSLDVIIKKLNIKTCKFIILAKNGGIKNKPRVNLSEKVDLPKRKSIQLMKHVLLNVSVKSVGYLIKDVEEDIISEIVTPKNSSFIRMGVPVVKYYGLSGVDLVKLQDLLEYAFQRKLNCQYFKELSHKKCVLYIAGDYKGVIIYTIEDGYNYLDKFAVGDMQGVGIGDLLWGSGKCFWRSRKGNFINKWYFEKADGFLFCGHWVLFWRGYTASDIETLKNIVLKLKPSFL